MSPVAFVLVSSAVAFLIGGIPFGYLMGRLVLKDDIRRHGSGNIGATNVGRVLGWKWGGLVLLLDALKGLLPTIGTWLMSTNRVSDEWAGHAIVAAGLSAIVGHMYPVYLKLRGGKGVATALGVVIILAPAAMGIALVIFLVTLITDRRMALASMLAAIAFGVAYLTLEGKTAWTPAAASRTAFAVAIPVLIIWRHRTNIQRLLSGTEPKVGQRTDS